ncbi:hypothetical protein [Glaciibacter psychrotolerans]|uniref:SipW-cognate class signal peptide n=1 Tax=Glaciibacter psychrotolerans TaxID=670054 RepID=A0A7Z0EFS2_9MICO|nr:hypothetical protein [Leifsonia psychrotolerans]NYJ20829.1 hypothetical protein [Leifsonia psychrotolerans]
MAKLKKKNAVVIAVAALVLIPAVAAFAYWTVGGSGTGTATTGTSENITVHQTSVVTGMYPGGTEQTLSGNFTNSDAGPVYVGTVTASIASVDKALNAAVGTCDASDYTLANAVMTVGGEVPVGTAVGAWGGATIKFNDKTSIQDACKGATVNLSYRIGAIG